MIDLNIENVEELIFYNRALRKLLPQFGNLFSQWELSKRVSGIKSLGQKAVIDFLQNIEDGHIKIIADFLNDNVSVTRLDYRIVKNIKLDLDEVEKELNYIQGMENLCMYRDDTHLYMSFWR